MARPPRTFASFVGQARIVRTLERLAEASLQNGKRVPHLLIVGPSGMGKTSLARALAAKHGNFGPDDHVSNMRYVAAGPNCLPAIHAVLCAARHGEFVFVDEAHALEREAAELLYPAIDDSVTLGLRQVSVDGAAKRKRSASPVVRIDRSRLEPIAPITIVLATNAPGRLPQALRSRVLPLELSAYSLRELKLIAERVGAQLSVELTPQAAREIAERCDGTPRAIQQLIGFLSSVNDTPCALTQTQVREQLAELLGHDEYGCTPTQRRVLEILVTAGGKLRPDLLRSRLGLDAAYLRQDLEPGLVARGFLTIKTDGLHEITEAGRAALGVQEDEKDEP